MKEQFRRTAKKVAEWSGSAGAFLLMLGVVLVWAITGPFFNYSENWQLVINTGTSVITFLMVFLIQNTQNRDSQMLHLKIGELIRSNQMARNDLINLDERSDEDLARLHQELSTLKQEADEKLEKIEKTRSKKRHRHDGERTPV